MFEISIASPIYRFLHSLCIIGTNLIHTDEIMADLQIHNTIFRLRKKTHLLVSTSTNLFLEHNM